MFINSTSDHHRVPLTTWSPRALVCSALLLAGCAGNESYQTVTTEDAEHAEAHADHDHGHHHEAPHGGHLIELGDHKYNAEVLLEGEPKQLVVYVLDAHAENPVAIESEAIVFAVEEGEPITLKPQPQEGDSEGKSSKFVAGGETVDAFGDIEDVHGSIQVTIEGTEYTGELSHDHDHDHGDHDHGGHDHHEGDHADE